MEHNRISLLPWISMLFNWIKWWLIHQVWLTEPRDYHRFQDLININWEYTRGDRKTPTSNITGVCHLASENWHYSVLHTLRKVSPVLTMFDACSVPIFIFRRLDKTVNTALNERSSEDRGGIGGQRWNATETANFCIRVIFDKHVIHIILCCTNESVRHM